MTLTIQHWGKLGRAERGELLRRPAQQANARVAADAARIIADVRARGDAALTALTRELDGVSLDAFRVDDDELRAAAGELTAEALAAIDLAIGNVHRFHEEQRPRDLAVETMPGITCERVSHPLDSVGLYVPAGSAPLPSAAIMLAVPAAIAGCPLRVLCTPPRPDGRADPAVLAAATRAGVTEIFKIGGAQAIAAMAYGTETVPKVCKVFGPGNAWVTAAKSLIAADPDGAAIDLPAGPSEVLVIADSSASAELVAADLLSQAEHGADSQAVLVTTSVGFAREVDDELARQVEALPRAAAATAAIGHSFAIVVGDRASAVEVSNRYAPEHLILQVEAPRELLADIRNAGSVFVGPWTPESVGDYCSGTNHVLPTYGHARAYSGLGLDQYLRYMTVQELTREGLAALGGTVITLAGLEGLAAHAAAVTRRLDSVS